MARKTKVAPTPIQPVNVAIYIRCSSSGQVGEDKYGADIQRSACAAYCLSQGWDVHGVYEDLGVTGTMLDRPGLQRLIADAEAGKITTVVFWRLDRLSRSLKDILALIFDVLEPMGVAVKSVTEALDSATPSGRLLLSILGACAEMDRSYVVSKLRDGRLVKHSRGGHSVGAVAIGYVADNRTLRTDPSTASIVKAMFSMALKGESLSGITRHLNRTGVASPRGAKWYPRTVKFVLTNRTYVGMAKDSTDEDAPEAAGVHEPLVSLSVFGRVQSMLSSATK